MLQEFEQTQDVVRRTIRNASTISDEEHLLELTQDDFIVIQWKMDKIDQKLNDLYRNWQAEYKNAVTSEDCDEVKRFSKPFLEKHESKNRILYQMLQQTNRQIDPASMPSAWEKTSDITPSLVALDDAQPLMKKEWSRNEPGEDILRPYSTPYGHLIPTQPRYEDMRMDSTLNVTPVGSLYDIPTASRENVDLMEAQRMLEAPEQQMVGNHPSATMSDGVVETPYTSVKVLSEMTPDEQMLRTSRLTDIHVPRRVQHMREASQEDALASARHFFAPENGQDQAILIRSHEETPNTTTGGAIIETSTITTTSAILAASTTATTADVGMGSSSPFLPNGSPL